MQYVYSNGVTYISDSLTIRHIDRSAGRVQLIDGDLYYSPNCTRQVKAPPLIPGNSEPFRYHPDKKRPRWWTPTYGWTAFIFLAPKFPGIPFDVLAQIPPPERRQDGFVMPAACIERWTQLEQAFTRATSALTNAYPTKAL